MSNYNILIVDDEELAIRGIERGVHWEKLKIDKVFKTHTLETAKRILRVHPIHILLSDIELAGDSGIELVRWARAKFPDLICIFFTCHAEFSYAQEAIKLGAVDYLLKPIPYEQLEKLLEKALLQLEEAEKEKKQFEIVNRLSGVEKIADEEDSKQKIGKVKKYIMENLSGELSRDELAAIANYSPSHLTKLFKLQEGISLSDHIVKKRIDMAKYLLNATSLPVAEIGTRVGFDYPSYFTSCFKKSEGMTPQKYREKSEEDIPGLDDI